MITTRSKFTIVLKAENKMETYRVSEKLFKKIKEIIAPYRSICPSAKAIRCIQINKIFKSARDVACWLCEKGLTKSSKANERIKNACRKNRRAYGLNWEFIE